MILRPSDTRELFARKCDFPAEEAAVVDAVGDVGIDSPNGETTDVRTVLERSSATRYASAADLHSTVMANLPADHVGRKRYDDRSRTAVRTTELSV
ncbi:hypothetical protein [Haloplanus halophilus]|uniref:DUF5789 family protein n=1 Tax=Haloplanus halophilus TaxID=2949993 RepID=UPI0020401B93|nr:hypothetical protein [Haloplanus sp. GDY1]